MDVGPARAPKGLLSLGLPKPGSCPGAAFRSHLGGAVLPLLGQEAPGVLCQIIPLSPHRLERCHKAFVPGTTAPSGSGPGASSVFLAASDKSLWLGRRALLWCLFIPMPGFLSSWGLICKLFPGRIWDTSWGAVLEAAGGKGKDG